MSKFNVTQHVIAPAAAGLVVATLLMGLWTTGVWVLDDIKESAQKKQQTQRDDRIQEMAEAILLADKMKGE